MCCVDEMPFKVSCISHPDQTIMIAKTLLRPNGGIISLKRPLITFLAARPDRGKKLERLTGVPTEYGWVMVKWSRIAKDWTTRELNKAIEQKLGDRAHLADKYEIQRIAEEWEQNVNPSLIPTVVTSKDDQKREANLQLYRDQIKGDSSPKSSSVRKQSTTTKPAKSASSSDSLGLSSLHAWNYYVAQKYQNYKHLLKKEARAAVGLLWRKLTSEEKDFYKDEYAALLATGKDILHGEIVDREVKIQATEKIIRAKENVRLRKQKKLQEEMSKYELS